MLGDYRAGFEPGFKSNCGVAASKKASTKRRGRGYCELCIGFRGSLAAKRWRLHRLGDPPPACPSADCSVGAGSAGHLSSPPGFLLLLCFNRRRRNLQPKNTNLRNLRNLRSLCSLRNPCSLCSLWRSLCSPYSRTLGSRGRAVCRDGVFRRLPYRRDRKSLGSRPRFLLLQE